MEKLVSIWPRSLFVMLMSLSVFAWADPMPELRIVTEDFPPYNFQIDGAAQGMSSEVVHAMLNHAGLEAEIEFLPWPRAYRIAEREPNTLIYSIARIPEREALFDWIGVIAPYRTSFYKLTSNTDLHIHSLAEARSYRVGVSQADVIQTYLEGQGFGQLEVARDDEIAVGMLFFDRMDLLAFDEAAMHFRVKEAGFDPNQVERVLRIEDLSASLYVAIHPDSDPAMIQTLKASLAAIKENGEYQAIRSRYFPAQGQVY